MVPNVSFRKAHQVRRTASSDKDDSNPENSVNPNPSGHLKVPPERGFGVQDSSVTVITIDSSGASANVSDEVFLPPGMVIKAMLFFTCF